MGGSTRKVAEQQAMAHLPWCPPSPPPPPSRHRCRPAQTHFHCTHLSSHYYMEGLFHQQNFAQWRKLGPVQSILLGVAQLNKELENPGAVRRAYRGLVHGA